jgi:hypothetical protein
MGEIIRKEAAVGDIIADVQTSYTKAIAKKGKWEQIASDRLTEVISIVSVTSQRLTAAEAVYAPLKAELDAFDEKADALVAAKYDEIWNIIGRPANDATLSILFPQGASYYIDGADEEQPDRMDMLAELLSSGIHPKLTKEKSQEIAKEISITSQEYRVIIEKVRVPRARVALLDRVQIAVARSAQLSLAAFKRYLKAEGFSEVEIHSVIPDRPRTEKTKPTPPTNPSA